MKSTVHFNISFKLLHSLNLQQFYSAYLMAVSFPECMQHMEGDGLPDLSATNLALGWGTWYLPVAFSSYQKVSGLFWRFSDIPPVSFTPIFDHSLVSTIRVGWVQLYDCKIKHCNLILHLQPQMLSFVGRFLTFKTLTYKIVSFIMTYLYMHTIYFPHIHYYNSLRFLLVLSWNKCQWIEGRWLTEKNDDR